MDLFYPSIAANSAGTVVIAYNGQQRSSSAALPWSDDGEWGPTFDAPLWGVLSQEWASYQNTDSTAPSLGVTARPA